MNLYFGALTLYNDILGTIGHTPLVRLNKIVPNDHATIFAKIESFNPMRSVKDRVARAMIEDAESTGELRPGMTIVEPTSGNSGIGLAMVCAAKGYDLIVVIPDTFSVERRRLIKAFGADLVVTPGREGIGGAICEAKRIVEGSKDHFLPLQFENPSNPNIHFRTTAIEICSAAPDLDAFVSAVGTGGTITGVGKYLKERWGSVEIVAVEPSRSPVLSGGVPGPHTIQGIGAGFVPSTCDAGLIDRIIKVEDREAVLRAREMANKEGILCGISSGAALEGALRIAKEYGEDKKIVVMLPDTGERYLSTDLFSD